MGRAPDIDATEEHFARASQSLDRAGKSFDPAAPLEAQNRRLQALVAELILENQTLRFDMTQLETRLRKNEQALKAATAWAGMLF